VPVKLAVAAVIVALVLGYFLGLWSDIGGWLNDLWNFLAASTLVPNWLLGLFAICVIIVAGLLGAGLRPTRKSADPEKNEPTE
jgi:ABC-type dipeptide/oligopeptide/nickel transport system permease component